MVFSMHAPPSVVGCGMVAIWFGMGFDGGSIDSRAGTRVKLYHYTDAAAVQSILTGNKMRLTNMRYLNDSEELLYGSNLVLTDIKEGKVKL
ncbi:hypothetical protein [Pseudomonas sp. 2(2015)]|uniref:hypothetical protein n=1 Tax=Pseudomonas sp. 2(2015) TaxID=1619950 RepID=UPI0012E0595F|nr:hypothetical protein [Pseudomonas sp. 2(2015)]